jgi:hypothetical protein
VSLLRLAFALLGNSDCALTIDLAPALHVTIGNGDTIKVSANKGDRGQLLLDDRRD